MTENEIRINETTMWREWITVRGLEPITLQDIDDRLAELKQQVKVEPEVKPESSGQFIKVWDSLPPIGKPVIIKTEYGKYDICYLRVENNNRLLWVNDMRPQHTDGSVIEWKEIE